MARNPFNELLNCDNGSDPLIKPVALIAEATEVNIQAGGLHDCVMKLDEAIELLRKCDECGSAKILLARALCLRTLAHYEMSINSTKNLRKDHIHEALELLDSNCYMLLAAKYPWLSSYTRTLLFYVLDVLITEHDENTHKLLQNIVSLFKGSDNTRMLWQFKSQHNHLNSLLIQNQQQANTIDHDFIVEEGESIQKLEKLVSNISSEVPLSIKSSCRLAQLFYDLSERMMLMGSMIKADEYAAQGLQHRYNLLNTSFKLKEHTLHMDHVGAARAWSSSSEDFILAPNSNLMCYLNSIYQVSTIKELTGDAQQARQVLRWGETISLERGLSFYVGRFQAFSGRIYRKIQDLDTAKEWLVQAQEHSNRVSCDKCKLMLELDIHKEIVKQSRKNGLQVRETMKEKLSSIEHTIRRHLKNENSNSKCWDRSCRLALINVLGEKGKEHVYENENKAAREVFLENMRLIISLSSIPSAQSPTTLRTLFEFVKNKDIKVFHGPHIAELIYIICWMTYAVDESDSDFDISKEMLIPTLKQALLLSSETPELLKKAIKSYFKLLAFNVTIIDKPVYKVSQLLAIMCMPKYDEETPKCENSLTHWQWACFFHQLTIGCGLNNLFSLRLSKVYGDSDEDKTLHRLTTRSDVELKDFVTKFYNELKPHTIVVMNILGDKYKKFMRMFRPPLVDSECVGYLMISRFSSTSEPRSSLFPVRPSEQAVLGQEDNLGPDEKPWIPPWGTDTIVDRMLPDFKFLIKHCETGSLHTTHDERLSKLICHMESWLEPNKNIMLGKILEGQNLGRFTGEGVNNSKTEPLFLLLGDEIHMLPWERTKIFENQEIYRMPSVSSIFYTYEKCHKSGRNIISNHATLDPSNAYYVIDPEIDNIDSWKLAVSLDNEFHLKGIFWRDVVMEILEKLKSHNLFIYCGHGDGLQYIPSDALKSLEVCASAILMGCSSGLLTLEGPYTPRGAAIDYLLAGSPIVVCNLWNIDQCWALELTETLLRTFKERMEDEAGIVASLDLARNKTPRHMYRDIVDL